MRCARDALLQERRVPRKFQIDDGVGGLQIQTGRTGVGGKKSAALRIALKRGDEAAPLFLRHAAVQAHKCGLRPLEQGFDEIEHAGPLAKENNLARRFGAQRLDQLADAL